MLVRPSEMYDLEQERDRYREALEVAAQALSDASVMVEGENAGWQERVYRRLCDEWEAARAALGPVSKGEASDA